MNGAGSDAGVSHGAQLLAFTEAVMADDEAALARERAALRGVLSPDCFVDVAGVIAAFNVVDRVADAKRDRPSCSRRSAANTPRGR